LKYGVRMPVNAEVASVVGEGPFQGPRKRGHAAYQGSASVLSLRLSVHNSSCGLRQFRILRQGVLRFEVEIDFDLKSFGGGECLKLI